MVVPSGREVVTGVDSVETPVVVRLRGTWISERGPVGFVMVIVSFPQTAPNVMEQKTKGVSDSCFGLDSVRDAYVSSARRRIKSKT